MATLLSEVRKNYSRVFRKFFIKRKLSTTGLFESSWVELTNDVKSWGKVRKEIDPIRFNQIRFNDVMLRVQNLDGSYNPHDDEASLWFGYGAQQRSLVKIEAGFLNQTLSSGGIWTNTYLPTTPSVFYGIISGDINLSDKNEVTLPVKPLLEVFRQFPARNLTGWTSTGLTASQFMTMIRDQTDGAGGFIFRPFFQDTTTNWSIATTTNLYANLNTSTAQDVIEATVWDIMEKLSSSEDDTIYVTREGVFTFGNKDANTTTSEFNYFGSGFLNNEYGHTIKSVSRYGKKYTDFYTRVQVHFVDSKTASAYRVMETAFTVTGNNDAWNFGHRTYEFENFWIPDTATADSILGTIYNNLTSLKDQIDFKATFVPTVDILDRITVSYDSSQQGAASRWDINDWAFDDTNMANDLYWDKFGGDAIRLVDVEFKLLSVTIDLDKLETTISAIRT